MDKEKAVLDPRHVLPGRGAYVHHDAVCMEAAVKRGGLAKTLRCRVESGLLTPPAARAPSRSELVPELSTGSKKDS
jgi:predicted RNA-binding protein YlxR (DUF448 family)